MRDLPEEEIQEVAADPAADDHPHDEVVAEDGSLAEHLRTVHGLDADPSLSPATQAGLHDRLHDTAKAADD